MAEGTARRGDESPFRCTPSVPDLPLLRPPFLSASAAFGSSFALANDGAGRGLLGGGVGGGGGRRCGDETEGAADMDCDGFAGRLLNRYNKAWQDERLGCWRDACAVQGVAAMKKGIRTTGPSVQWIRLDTKVGDGVVIAIVSV